MWDMGICGTWEYVGHGNIEDMGIWGYIGGVYMLGAALFTI